MVRVLVRLRRGILIHVMIAYLREELFWLLGPATVHTVSLSPADPADPGVTDRPELSSLSDESEEESPVNGVLRICAALPENQPQRYCIISSIKAKGYAE